MRTSLRTTIVAVAAFGLGVAVCNIPSRSVRAAGREPVALELDDMERMAYESLLANFDHALELEIGRLHASYRLRHQGLGEGALYYVRGKGLFVVPPKPADVAPVESASSSPKKRA